MRRAAAFISLFLLLWIMLPAEEVMAARKTAGRKIAGRKSARPDNNVKPDEKRPAFIEKRALVSVPTSDVYAHNSDTSERVTQVLLGDEFIVKTEEKGWAYGYIPSQKGYRGWIRTETISYLPEDPGQTKKYFVQVKQAKARITFSDGSFINVYAGTRLPLLNSSNGRYEVKVPTGATGFLPLNAALVEDDHFGKDVTPEDIMQASRYYGPGYKWGGITAGSMDCSGFVYTIFRINGIYLKRDSYMQAEEGLDVALEDLKAGDLVFFKSGKADRITHVGIYIGNGNFIHSSRTKKGVAISSLNEEQFKKSFVGARRILNFGRTVEIKEEREQMTKQLENDST